MYYLYGIKDDIQLDISCDANVYALIDQAEYILLKAKRYTECKIYQIYNKIEEPKLMWHSTTEMLSKNTTIYPASKLIEYLTKEVFIAKNDKQNSNKTIS